MGPIASFVIAISLCYLAFTFDIHGALKVIFIVFAGSAILDLMINLIPNNIPIKLDNGTFTYNDGKQLQKLFYYKRHINSYKKAIELFDSKDFISALVVFENFIAKELADENTFRLAISAYLQIKNYKQADILNTHFESRYALIFASEDYATAGFIKSHSNLHEEALIHYQKALDLNPNNLYALNNRGYTYNIFSKFHEAISDFDKVINLDSEFADSYSNRGVAKIKLGQIEDGLRDINYSLELNPNNAYAYIGLGSYYLDNNNKLEAYNLFMKAKSIDSEAFGIDELIEKAKN